MLLVTRHEKARLLIALLVLSCNGRTYAEQSERNILLVVTDDESPTLGCYGDSIAHTPCIDAIAADGTRFDSAFATVASCSPSRAVILSGIHSHKNGQYGLQHRNHHFTSFHDVESLTLPRSLAAEGYRTARCGKFHVAPESAYKFETLLKGEQRNVVQMAENCREFLEDRATGRPFFLYFATNDPHRSRGIDETSRRRLKPNLFGNLPGRQSYAGVEEVFYDPERVPIPTFLPDSPETREELSQYYQSCSRVDQGLGRLVEILKESGLYDQTLIVFTSDHGMAFAGAKTTVYDAALRVPLVIRNPYEARRGVVSHALVSHIDIAPSLLDFAGGLDHVTNAPTRWKAPNKLHMKDGNPINRSGDHTFRRYQGKSWLDILSHPSAEHHEMIFASHTFHEVQMYYPMRVVRDHRYKLIWNIAHKLEFPFAADLWRASSWQAQIKIGLDAPYGPRTVASYIERPEFELYDIREDPDEINNLAESEEFAETLEKYQRRLRQMQNALEDPWVLKWEYE